LNGKKEAIKRTGRIVGKIFAWIGRIVSTVLLLALTTSAILAVLAAFYINNSLREDFNIDLRGFNLNLTSFVYYLDKDTGEYTELARLSGRENRVWVSYSEMPRHIEHAVVAIEDKRFYDHSGVDWRRTAGAFMNMFTGRGSFGGSTVTQQLIKNLTGHKEATVQRKIVEIMTALEVERNYGKEELMEFYLNTIYLGQGCYGIKTAAQVYFGKEVSELTIAESAALVAITNNPSLFDPYLNPIRNRERQVLILNEMLSQGYITQSQHRQAMAEELDLRRNRVDNIPAATQSYYVDQVVIDVSRALAETMNVDLRLARQSIYSAGYHIYTCIDMRVQGIMDDIFGHEDNYPVVRGLDKPQVAMTVLDPYTGDILGLIGGRGEKTGAMTLNRATQSRRSPGSAIKPLSVFAPAIDLGYITPYSAIKDAPFRKDSRGNMYPRNLNAGYAGQMSAMYAMQISNNAGCMWLVDMITPQRSFAYLTDHFNFTTLVRERTIGNTVHTDIDYAPLALGGMTFGVTTREMAAAFGAFVNRGVYNQARTFTHITDSEGNIIIDRREPVSSQAVKEETAFYMNLLLANVVRQGTGMAAQLPNNMPAAGKTGTTTNDHDRWWVGYTPYYVGATWFGFDEPQEIRLEIARNPATNMWRQVMARLHEDKPHKSFFDLSGIVSAEYCLDSGMMPKAACRSDTRGSRARTGQFAPRDVPRDSCNIHTMITVDADTRNQATPFCGNTMSVGVLTINRRMPMSGAVLADEQFVLRSSIIDLNDGKYPPAAPSNAGSGFNIRCPGHAAAPPPVIPSPGDGTDEPDGSNGDGETDSAGTPEPPPQPPADTPET
jgi:penicillin-binding protein 1A